MKNVRKIKAKQVQWGITLLIGIVILVGTVGHLENGGELAPNIFKGILGMVISFWGLIKSYQWGFFDES